MLPVKVDRGISVAAPFSYSFDLLKYSAGIYPVLFL
jgi:hypothetical protein